MRLVILGSGNADHHGGRAGSGCLLFTPAPVLLDFGPGNWIHLARAGVDPAGVRLVLLSHLHPDHFSDLVPMLFHQSWSLKGKTRESLTILGPPGTRQVIGDLRRVVPHLGDHGFPIEVRDMESGTFRFGAVEARPVPVPHVEDLRSLAWRVGGPGGVFAYSGDCRAGEELVRALEGADLAVVEATCPDDRPYPTHLTAGQACEAARRAGVRSLVLTHFSRDWEGRDPEAECAGRFPGPLRAAADLMSAEFGTP